jgi:hypothetical protein
MKIGMFLLAAATVAGAGLVLAAGEGCSSDPGTDGGNLPNANDASGQEGRDGMTESGMAESGAPDSSDSATDAGSDSCAQPCLPSTLASSGLCNKDCDCCSGRCVPVGGAPGQGLSGGSMCG